MHDYRTVILEFTQLRQNKDDEEKLKQISEAYGYRSKRWSSRIFDIEILMNNEKTETERSESRKEEAI